jgi:hypothetical protein
MEIQFKISFINLLKYYIIANYLILLVKKIKNLIKCVNVILCDHETNFFFYYWILLKYIYIYYND